MTPERLQKMKDVASKRQFDLTVIAENIHDPHNIFAISRTCDAVGVQEIYVIDGVDAFSKLEEWSGGRSSSSANKWVDLHLFTDMDSCIKAVRKKYDKIYCTRMQDEAQGLYSLDLSGSVALVFGNERKGVSEELASRCDGNFLIPQVGMIRSLNVSVACAVSLYEAFRQRHANSGTTSTVKDDKAKELLKRWIE